MLGRPVSGLVCAGCSVGRLKIDDDKGLILPMSHYKEKRETWIEAVCNALLALGIRYDRIGSVMLDMTEDEQGIRVWNKNASQTYVLDTREAQLVPPQVLVQVVHQWYRGKLDPDAMYRMMTPQEQIRFSNRFREKPIKDGQDPQAALDRDLKLREDVRKQGLDPLKEGLT